MLRLFLSVLLMVVVLPSFGQEEELKIGLNVNKHIFIYGGIIFEPLTTASNKPDTVLCDAHIERFYLNGLQLKKEQFVNLKLAPKYLINDSTTILTRSSSKRGYGTYNYEYGNNKKCANQIVYRAKVKLPIILNGVELGLDKQRGILRNISYFEIFAVERKSFFFGGGGIYIETKSRH